MAQSTTTAPESIEELVDRYYRAYNDHDLEGILALQTADAEYRLHGTEVPMKWVGTDACREVYERHLGAWPDQRLRLDSVVVAENLCACHLHLTGTLAVPWEMAGRTYEPTGRPVTFELVHIMQCEGNLVKVKDGWIDAIAIHNQLTGQSR